MSKTSGQQRARNCSSRYDETSFARLAQCVPLRSGINNLLNVLMANKPLTCAANGLKGFGMCKGCKNCPCSQVRTLAANLLPSESKIVNYLGRRMLVVPLIMARADVVMNGGYVPVEEMSPEAWNGRPVTVGHPDDGNG